MQPVVRILRLPDVCAIVRRSKPTIYRGIAAGTFPAPIKLGENSVGWKVEHIEAWLASRPIAECGRRAEAKRAEHAAECARRAEAERDAS